MRLRKLSFTTFNLYNLNLPGRRMYRRAGWSEEEYARKIAWTADLLKIARADVFGFQELWHKDALEAAFAAAGLSDEYSLIVPEMADGARIVTAAAVANGLLESEARWIEAFPEAFRLESGGDDPQTPDIAVNLSGFARPVLKLRIRPRDDQPAIEMFVAHLKSKRPTDIYNEGWYRRDRDRYADHRGSIGSALSTIRRSAEAAALRILLTDLTKQTGTPAVVVGDLNDGQRSNTLAILTEQPKYLTTLRTGGRDTALYSGQTMQQLRSERDVYYTYIYEGARDSLDHIIFSEEFYDNSDDRIWAFDGLDIYNDHLNREEDRDAFGATDHGIVRIRFDYKPAPARRP